MALNLHFGSILNQLKVDWNRMERMKEEMLPLGCP
jgi:uncharacterized membrane protein (DUF106 family)